MVLDVVKTKTASWPVAGGTAANVAANLAYLGWQSSVVARLGADAAGRRVRADLSKAGVDVRRVNLDAAVATPIIEHLIRTRGHGFHFGCSTCGRGVARYRAIDADDALSAAKAPSDVFFFDRPARANTAMAALRRAAGCFVVYEPATRATAIAHSAAIAVSDVVKCSHQRFAAFQDRLPPPRAGLLSVLTRGAQGVDVRLGSRKWRSLPAVSVQAHDTGGAGDWMTAALIHRLAKLGFNVATLDDEDLMWAQGVAALSTLLPGARTLASAVPRARLSDRVRSIRKGVAIRMPEPDLARTARKNACAGCGLPAS